MNYNIIATPDFKKYFKKLSKKYPFLKQDLTELLKNLQVDYSIWISLGGNLFKIRLAIESKNKGKSGGARVIYFFVAQDSEIYLIHIFDKGEFENIPKAILLDLIKNAGLI